MKKVNYKLRAERERVQHEKGLERRRIESLMKHSHAYSSKRVRENLKSELRYAHGKRVLELGSSDWHYWLERFGIVPCELHCINNSERELEKGRNLLNEHSLNTPIFHLSDAHELTFEDHSMDMVYGSAILHHLELDKACKEICRVLKPGGRMVFMEPLDINPIFRIIRRLTPQSRTDDEIPFTFRELATLREYFDLEIKTYELFKIPAGVISKILFKSPENFIMKSADFVDRSLKKLFPPIRWYYRRMMLIGSPKNNMDGLATGDTQH